MGKVGYLICVIIAAAIVAIGLDFILAVPIMYLWNWLMPKIFGLCEIGYWQAFGLYLLISMLFGRFNANTNKNDD